MPSERRTLKENVNDSKNTRMNLAESMDKFDLRKDEFMHLGRYFKACETMISLAKELGRPLRVLDIGCGEIYIPRVLYKSFLVKKSDIIQRYVGIDIDDIMLSQIKESQARLIETCNVKLIKQDLTVNPKLKVKDGYFDVIVWFENIEHMKPEFIPPIRDEVVRVLSPAGIALISTPNSAGSNAKLPKDHVYEWSYDEMMDLLDPYFEVDPVGVGLNPSKIPKDQLKKREKLLKRVEKAFGTNTAFSTTAVAPLFSPEYCKNVLYICRLKEATYE